LHVIVYTIRRYLRVSVAKALGAPSIRAIATA
jgi:hypothetical protein